MSDYYGLISSGIGALVDFASVASDSIWQYENLKYNKELNEQAQRNYQEQFQFQKDVWNKTMEREDNAYQRAVLDMKKAGLNPAGLSGGASASGVSTVAQPRLQQVQGNLDRLGAADFAIKLQQLKMQKDMNEANVNNVNADTALKNVLSGKYSAETSESGQRLLLLLEQTQNEKNKRELMEKQKLIMDKELSKMEKYIETQDLNNYLLQLKNEYWKGNTDKFYEMLENEWKMSNYDVDLQELSKKWHEMDNNEKNAWAWKLLVSVIQGLGGAYMQIK